MEFTTVLNVPATSQIFASTSSPVVVPPGTQPNANSNTLQTNHDLMVSNLNPSTTYHYFVEHRLPRVRVDDSTHGVHETRNLTAVHELHTPHEDEEEEDDES